MDSKYIEPKPLLFGLFLGTLIGIILDNTVFKKKDGGNA